MLNSIQNCTVFQSFGRFSFCEKMKKNLTSHRPYVWSCCVHLRQKFIFQEYKTKLRRTALKHGIQAGIDHFSLMWQGSPDVANHSSKGLKTTRNKQTAIILPSAKSGLNRWLWRNDVWKGMTLKWNRRTDKRPDSISIVRGGRGINK